MKKAIYVGSFDPLHNGHISIIKKALKITQKLIVVVANNPEKSSSSLKMRFLNVKKMLAIYPSVDVKKMETGLIAEFAKINDVKFLIRSARDEKDFNFELMMAIQNKKINKNIETILVFPNKSTIKIRSSILPK